MRLPECCGGFACFVPLGIMLRVKASHPRLVRARADAARGQAWCRVAHANALDDPSYRLPLSRNPKEAIALLAAKLPRLLEHAAS